MPSNGNYTHLMPAKTKSTKLRATEGRYTEIGGVRVKLAPAWRVLPKIEDARLRQAVKDFYADKKAK